MQLLYAELIKCVGKYNQLVIKTFIYIAYTKSGECCEYTVKIVLI